MRRLFLLLILFGIFFSSCKSVQIADLRPAKPNSHLLQSLEPQIDISSLQNAYTLGTTISAGGGYGYEKKTSGGIIGTASYLGMSTSVTDKRIQDAVILFEREVRDNISYGNDKPVGFATCRITTGGTKWSGLGWYSLSLITLTVPNWFGMPVFNYKTELEIEVEIKDCNNVTLGRYTGYGYKKIPVAAYYGYYSLGAPGNKDAERKSNIDAFKMAMSEIKIKIEKDFEKLNKELKNCNK